MPNIWNTWLMRQFVSNSTLKEFAQIITLLLTVGRIPLISCSCDIYWGAWLIAFKNSGFIPLTFLKDREAAVVLFDHIYEICTCWLNFSEPLRIKRKVLSKREKGERTKRESERSGKNVSGKFWRSAWLLLRNKRIVVVLIPECGSPVTSQRHEVIRHW